MHKCFAILLSCVLICISLSSCSKNEKLIVQSDEATAICYAMEPRPADISVLKEESDLILYVKAKKVSDMLYVPEENDFRGTTKLKVEKVLQGNYKKSHITLPITIGLVPVKEYEKQLDLSFPISWIDDLSEKEYENGYVLHRISTEYSYFKENHYYIVSLRKEEAISEAGYGMLGGVKGGGLFEETADGQFVRGEKKLGYNKEEFFRAFERE